MDYRQAYINMLERHQKDINEFPIAFAFNEQQLEEALEKLGATKEECVSLMGVGDIIKKSDVDSYIAMISTHLKEVRTALLDENFAEAAFLYEMDNHEYAINSDGDYEVLKCFGLTYPRMVEKGLESAYFRAKEKHMENAKEWM